MHCIGLTYGKKSIQKYQIKSTSEKRKCLKYHGTCCEQSRGYFQWSFRTWIGKLVNVNLFLKKTWILSLYHGHLNCFNQDRFTINTFNQINICIAMTTLIKIVLNTKDLFCMESYLMCICFFCLGWIIEQWGFFSVIHLLWHGNPFTILIFENPWYSYLTLSVWH